MRILAIAVYLLSCLFMLPVWFIISGITYISFVIDGLREMRHPKLFKLQNFYQAKRGADEMDRAMDAYMKEEQQNLAENDRWDA